MRERYWPWSAYQNHRAGLPNPRKWLLSPALPLRSKPPSSACPRLADYINLVTFALLVLRRPFWRREDPVQRYARVRLENRQSRRAVEFGRLENHHGPSNARSLPGPLMAILEKHREWQRQGGNVLGSAYQDDGLVFARLDGSFAHRGTTRRQSVGRYFVS